MVKQKSDREKKLDELFKKSELSDLDWQYAEADSAEELIENLETQINEIEVIYYTNAIKYLAENDASLNESMSLASDLGYEVKNINSELLATLLQQENLRNALNELRKDIEAIYDEE